MNKVQKIDYKQLAGELTLHCQYLKTKTQQLQHALQSIIISDYEQSLQEWYQEKPLKLKTKCRKCEGKRRIAAAALGIDFEQLRK